MRAHGSVLGKRFAIVIGVAAAAVMAFGAQTAAAATYNTRVTITQAPGGGTLIHGDVYSAARKCEVRRRVVVFRQQRGTDRRLGVAEFTQAPSHWDFFLPQRRTGWHVYAKVRPKERDQFVCRPDRSKTLTRLKYDTKLTIAADRGPFFHGFVKSEGGRKCKVERRVVLFRQRPGPDAVLGTDRSEPTSPHSGSWGWGVKLDGAPSGTRVYAKAKRKVRDRYVCLADRSETYTWGRAQTTAAAPDVVKYDTKLTIALDRANIWHGFVKSEVRKCERGQSVNLFRQRPGTDAKLGKDTRTEWAGRWPWGQWLIQLQQLAQDGWRVYAKVTPKERDRFVCRADRSEIYTWGSGG